METEVKICFDLPKSTEESLCKRLRMDTLVPLFFVYFSVFRGGLREDGVLLDWVLSS